MKFQSPRSGKFVSDLFTAVTLTKRDKCFNPLDRGNLYQIRSTLFGVLRNEFGLFQSPRSGKFVSDRLLEALFDAPEGTAEFQSPRSGKFVSDKQSKTTDKKHHLCFNPLDRGNLYQISFNIPSLRILLCVFQSPRSGKFVSDSMLNCFGTEKAAPVSIP